MSGALAGVKIADFSWVGAGPRATKDLADHGATVVKVESRKRLDLGRLSPPFKNGKRDPDGSAFFAITNTSKLGVTINLSDPRGIDVAKKLVAWADVVVENFGKGFMERIGLGFDVLRALRPDLIYLSVSVAGREGPMSDLRGYGNSAAALSGLAALSGWPDREPHMPPFAYGDVVAPMFATVAVLAALEHRRVTGEGSRLDVSQVEPLVHVLGDVIARAQIEGFAKPVPHGVYPARGHDQWIAIDVRDEAGRARLEAMAGDDLAAWTTGQDKHILAERLQQAGIAAEAVADGRDVFSDPELVLGSHFVPISHPVLGTCDMPGPPADFSASEVVVGPPPRLGEHNHQVFVEMLGIDAGEIAALAEAGVLS
ncbi:CoA transferase [Sphingomonas sp.]|uniref:CaiB/BaiF CoA transferase family protein n=1 Tax=Sphingomonas sp. TaxID=28214 RepID=UPI001B291DD6|nr:CoA transferase [Sphingomonas sp.]MBO9714573.1 CoA transferase [Sphingomonas sp.]